MAIASPPTFSQTEDLHVLRSDTGIVFGDRLTVSWPTGADSSDSGTLTDYLKLNRNDFTIEFQPVRRFAGVSRQKTICRFWYGYRQVQRSDGFDAANGAGCRALAA